ncbi:hypothetical protein ACFFX1_08215 [Dactylosporangium sucinum]|uniref:Secreted protein n=1 Tax=Dactylosporangium sucinum TaxID=1424081 RepID=A0A917U479_9ACTN|nr:hypothetical protein [Dactylosporangium sucinum]GGM52137.1 hypothetical protein GCM10007977_062220 [Dactylosporangium sucinum]
MDLAHVPASRRAVLRSALLASAAYVAPGLLSSAAARAATAVPRSVSGIYPTLAMFNNEDECGTGAVVPWSGRLWVTTYGPHLVKGSSDKLYEVTPDLQQVVRPESVGGTHANRMIHEESRQLFIACYVIREDGTVRTIARDAMPGRLTGTARHINDPRNKVHFATMEEGLYSVDVNTLEVWGEIRDGNSGLTSPTHPAAISSKLPGYHGKGLYTQGDVLIYSNNGDQAPQAQTDPTTASGALAEWRGSGDWQLIRRNQFTELTGPAGIAGGSNSPGDAVWALGWDHRSLILNVRQDGEWHSYRLPKGSHSYDGAHGWNTEWPRIREIGQGDELLMTMHGGFWRFPAGFRVGRTAGIRPRSNYLKVIGDFARWEDKVVFGCDDTAVAEFYNKRRHKGNIAGPGQSQSNLWFVDPADLDGFGFAIGRGTVWNDDPVEAGDVSDPFLVAGFDRRVLHLTHDSERTVTFTIEVDRMGDGVWTSWLNMQVPGRGYKWVGLPSTFEWVRLRTDRAAQKVTAAFSLSNIDRRSSDADPIFDALARIGDRAVTGGLVRARGANLRTLAYVVDRPAADGATAPVGYYELNDNLTLARVNDPDVDTWHRTNVAVPVGVLEVDEASVLVIDDKARRWRLPKLHDAYETEQPLGPERIAREVCTERDLFNAHGTFYELPAENAGGFSKMRPVATHGRRIKDYCSYRGMVVLTGLRDNAPASEHVLTSTDGKTALWVGVADDLWKLGRPRGVGGPWKDTPVIAGKPSDPYLMTAYQEKIIRLSHKSDQAIDIAVQVDLTGEGRWVTYQTFTVRKGRTVTHMFPAGFSAYWMRTVAMSDATATAQLVYS